MANTHANAMASFGSPVGAGGFFAQFGALVAARRGRAIERARIRRELNSYSDRQLSDLGLSRFDIEAVAAGRFQR